MAPAVPMPPQDLCLDDPSTIIVGSGEIFHLTTQRINGCIHAKSGGTIVADEGFDAAVQMICAMDGSTLKMGSGRLTILDAPPDDAGQYGTGIIAMGATVLIDGKDKAPWGWLSSEPVAGAVTVNLAFDPVGWNVGDRILLPDTRDRFATWLPATPEVRVITGISGRSITFDQPLAIDHPGHRNGNSVLERSPMVANLTRSLVITSENPNGHRGHFMVCGAATGHIRNIATVDFGRTTNDPLDPVTNHIGRYAIHLHGVTTPNFEVSGCVVERYRRWAVDDHNTDSAWIHHNVAFDGWGAAFVNETGAEVDSIIEDNLAVLIHGTGQRGDERFGFSPFEDAVNGSGFWINGPDCRWRRNVVVNAQMYGLTLWGGSFYFPNQPPRRLKEFTDNEAWSCPSGLSPWVGPATITRVKLIHNGYGNEGYPALGLIYDAPFIRNDPRVKNQNYWSSGLQFGDYFTPDLQIINPDIQNCLFGLALPFGYAAAMTDANVDALVQGGYLDNNQVDIYDRTAAGSYPAISQRPVKYTLRGTVHGPRSVESIRKEFRVDGLNSSLTALHTVKVEDFQGVIGDNFEVFANEQAPEFVIPAGGYAQGAEGLTNQQAWNTLGVAIFGALRPTDAVRRAGINGWVSSAGSITPPPPSPLMTNLQVQSNRAGQMDVVFDTNGHPGPFDVYVSTSPIAALTGLTPIARVDTESWHYRYDDSAGVGNLSAGFVLKTGGARLVQGQAFYPFTIHSTSPYHFAVAPAGSTQFIAVGPFSGMPATPGLVWLEGAWRQPSGPGTDSYRMAWQWQDFTRWEPTFGYPGHKFEVTQAAGSVAPNPATLNLHGAGGNGYIEPSGYLGVIGQIGIYVSPRDEQFVGIVDPYVVGDRQQSFWKGYTGADGQAHPVTAERITNHLLACVADASLQIDPNRIYANGGSMGGEAIHVAAYRPDVFAAAEGSIGIWTWDTVPGVACGTPAPSTDAWWDTRTHALKLMPPVILAWGTEDTTKQPCGGANAVAALQANRRAYLADWRVQGHVAYNIQLDGHPWYFRFRKDEAYLAFSNNSSNDSLSTAAGIAGDPGHAAGQHNQKVDWHSRQHSIAGGSAIADAVDGFGVSIVAVTACKTDITITNLQKFRPTPGTALTWTLGSQTGSTTADAEGRITIAGVNVSAVTGRLSVVTMVTPPPPPPSTVTVNCTVVSVGKLYADKDAQLTIRADTNGGVVIPKGFTFTIQVPK